MKKTAYSTIAFLRRHPKLDLLALGIGLAIFIAIVLLNITRAGIWFDEAFSAYIVQFNFWDIARYTASDVHPPFYYWLLKIWSSIFGTTEFGYRSLSALFGVAAIAMTFFMSRKFFGRKVAWVTLALLVASPMLIRYSDEARMYTLAAVIVLAATYVLQKARTSRSLKPWVLYGALVSLGMWTHYFTAVVWLAHLAWYALDIRTPKQSFKEWRRALFKKPLVVTYMVAIGLFVPWLPFMTLQLGTVQASGFWISPVSVDTPANYLTNYFYYLEHGQTAGYLALLAIGIVVLTILRLPATYRALVPKQRRLFLLIAAIAFVPPVLLFLASLPPLRPSFVERYLIPSLIALSIFFAIVFVVGTRRWKVGWRALPIVLVVGMMIFGISNVYRYGNFNKNTNINVLTSEVIKQIGSQPSGNIPIVAESPWIFYEAIPYATAKHPVYFIGKTAEQNVGSLTMLQKNDMYKIKDMKQFAKENPVIWYLGSTTANDVSPYSPEWKKLETVSATDPITGNTLYRATKYRISAE